MSVRPWLRPPRHVLAIFVAVAVVSAAALTWLMWSLLEQDKTVEMQRAQDRLEQAADHATTLMQGALSDLERGAAPPAGVVTAKIEGDRLTVQPQSLLYYPELPKPPEASTGRFAEGEQAEFTRNDLHSASEFYARSAESTDDAVRAAALTRLARVRRKSQDHDGALHAYDSLAKIPNTTVSGLPAALLAREGRASVFEETHRAAELQAEALAFDEDLRKGRWQLTKSEYEFYSAEVRGWLGRSDRGKDPDAIARAEAVVWLWENRDHLEPVVRRLVAAGESPALVVSRATPAGLVAAVAGPNYLASLCHDAAPDAALQCTLSDEGRAVVGDSPPARMVAVRTAAAAKLPWTLHIFATDPRAVGASPRRGLLVWVAAVLALVWLVGATFIVRAMRREAKVTQLQSDFVAAVSHEFRSPLSSLCQLSELLSANRLPSDDQRRNAYAMLSRESERLRRLVEGLLDFQRFEAGADVYHFESLEIGGFLKSIVADFQERASSHSIELQALESETYVKADREALTRAIWNLLDNAVKYSPECKTVWVDLARQNDRVSIAVRDNGLGIPMPEQREIFEKFVRGADSKARRIKGTGIGLAMVRHIVEAHGAEILLASRPGEGSRFTIVFPPGVAVGPALRKSAAS